MADGQGTILVGIGTLFRRHELMARHLAQGPEHGGIERFLRKLEARGLDVRLNQLHHGAARNGVRVLRDARKGKERQRKTEDAGEQRARP